MQELLLTTSDPNVPFQRQERFELRPDDLGTPFQPQFLCSKVTVARHTFLSPRLMPLGQNSTAISCGTGSSRTNALR